jgi:phage shock protein C
MRDATGHRVLVRPRDGRMLAGVCAGFADYFGLDVTLVRVIWAVVSVITGGAGILAYLVTWIIMPDAGQQSSVAENTVGEKQDSYSG